jgi:hypothetical protein
MTAFSNGLPPRVGRKQDQRSQTLARPAGWRDRVALSADEIADLNSLARRAGVHGDRYNATHMRYVNR